jgi:hypothetical protein
MPGPLTGGLITPAARPQTTQLGGAAPLGPTAAPRTAPTGSPLGISGGSWNQTPASAAPTAMPAVQRGGWNQGPMPMGGQTGGNMAQPGLPPTTGAGGGIWDQSPSQGGAIGGIMKQMGPQPIPQGPQQIGGLRASGPTGGQTGYTSFDPNAGAARAAPATIGAMGQGGQGMADPNAAGQRQIQNPQAMATALRAPAVGGGGATMGAPAQRY